MSSTHVYARRYAGTSSSHLAETELGIVPRCISSIFGELQKRPDNVQPYALNPNQQIPNAQSSNPEPKL